MPKLRGDSARASRDRRLSEARRWNGRDPRRPGAGSADDVGEAGDHVGLERSGREAALDRGPPAAVADARQRPAGLEACVRRDLAHRPLGVRCHLAHLELHGLGAQVPVGALHQSAVRRGAEPRRRARRAAAAVLRVGIVELLLEDAHQTAAVGSERRHRRLLGAAQRGDLRVAVAVVVPVARRGRAASGSRPA